MSNFTLKLDNSAIKKIATNFENRTLRMAWDIATQGTNNAPVLSGDLAGSIRAEKRGEGEIVAVAGGSSVGVPYALRREYENNAHPSTKHYMKRAKENVMKGNWVSKYYGGLV